jgi:hypothetical protein
MLVDASVAIAKVFGPFMVILGMWMLLFRSNMQKVWASMKATPCCFFCMSLINLLLGIFIISQCNLWLWDKTFLVTALGWFLFLRGVMALFVPQLLARLAMPSEARSKHLGAIPLLWGMFLCWHAFA